MKRLIKTLVSIALAGMLLFSTAVTSLAGDDGDPVGCKCAYVPYIALKPNNGGIR